MSLFGVGAWEVILVLVILLLVVGPNRLPEMAVQLARSVRWLRRFAGQVTGQFRQEFDELVREYEELRQEVSELRQQVNRDATALSEEVDTAVQELRTALPRGSILETPGEPLLDDKPPEPSSPSP